MLEDTGQRRRSPLLLLHPLQTRHPRTTQKKRKTILKMKIWNHHVTILYLLKLILTMNCRPLHAQMMREFHLPAGEESTPQHWRPAQTWTTRPMYQGVKTFLNMTIPLTTTTVRGTIVPPRRTANPITNHNVISVVTTKMALEVRSLLLMEICNQILEETYIMSMAIQSLLLETMTIGTAPFVTKPENLDHQLIIVHAPKFVKTSADHEKCDQLIPMFTHQMNSTILYLFLGILYLLIKTRRSLTS
jgi:hypothetical protein